MSLPDAFAVVMFGMGFAVVGLTVGICIGLALATQPKEDSE